MHTVQTQLKDGRKAVIREATVGDAAAALDYLRKVTAARQFAVAGAFHDAYLMGLKIDPAPGRNGTER